MLMIQEQTEQQWSFGCPKSEKIKPVLDTTKQILLVTNYTDSLWSRLTASIIAQFGALTLIRYHELQVALQNQDVAAVIMDDDSSVDAVAFITHIRTLYPGIPILISANSVSWIRARTLLGAGANDYFFATLDRSVLLRTLQKHLGNMVGDVDSQAEETQYGTTYDSPGR